MDAATDSTVEANLAQSARGWPGYNTIWRWHFYAGLLCLPFIFWLPITGAIYLFKPQIEAWLDQPYEHLAVTGAPASPTAQVAAALAAVPGSVLHAYILPPTPESAVRVLAGKARELYRVYVHPQTLEILKLEREDQRLMRVIFHLHGELLLGSPGSMLVELAASWAIVMIVTGLYLWWPRDARGLAGIAYPRLDHSGRTFWRDLHAVTGLWVSLFVLFLLLSGLPWAKFWGGTLKELRQAGSSALVRLDWTTGRTSELAERLEMNTPLAVVSRHAGHQHGTSPGGPSQSNPDYRALDRMVTTVQPLQLAPPVLIAPPSKRSPSWTARSDAPNRMLHVDLVLDETNGNITSRRDFAQRPLLDRAIGIGVSAHEGQLFGWPNQALGLLTAVGLMLMAASSIVMWWRRRRPGTVGAPPAVRSGSRLAYSFFATVFALGVLLPLFGISAIAVAAIDRWVLRRLPVVSRFLGLSHAVV